MSWDLNYIIDRTISKTASIGASGLDYSQFSPCTGTKDCGTCKHINATMKENKDEETGEIIDKDNHAIHQQALDFHKTHIPAIAEQQGEQQ
jgi:hypothetical protein